MSDLQVIPETHPDSLSNLKKKPSLPITSFVGESISPKHEVASVTTPQVKEVIQLHTTKEKAQPRPTEAQPQKEILAPRSGELALGNPNQVGRGQQGTTISQVLSKISGYQSSQMGVNTSFVNDPQFPQNLVSFTKSGKANDSSLWQATLLLKVYKAWQLVFGF